MDSPKLCTFFSSNPAKEQGELFIFRTSNGGAKKKSYELCIPKHLMVLHTKVWQMRIYPTAWLGFHLAPCPPGCLEEPVRMDSKGAKSGDFGWGFRGDTAGYGKWPIFSLYIYKIAMASIAMWNYQSIFKVHDSHMNLWDEIQTETSTHENFGFSSWIGSHISGVSLKFSPYHLVI